jgi:hypothetical protein
LAVEQIFQIFLQIGSPNIQGGGALELLAIIMRVFPPALPQRR